MKVLKQNRDIVLFEFFGGIGCQHEAFKNAGYQVIHYLIERDIESVIGYAALHCNLNEKLNFFVDLPKEEYIQFLEKFQYTKNEKPVSLSRMRIDKLKRLYHATILTNNFGDFNNIKIDDLDEILTKHKGSIKIATWSTPCQDFTVAGKMKGFEGTRGTLTQKTVEFFLKTKEKLDYLIFENVPAITNKRHKDKFDLLINQLSQRYKSKYFLLNAYNYEIPQNRKRIFMISSADKTYEYQVPVSKAIVPKLSDFLEKEVDTRYFISSEQLARFRYQGNVNPSGNGMTGRVNTKDVANTLMTRGDQKILIRENTKQGYKEACEGDGISLNFIGAARGVVQKSRSPTLLTGAGGSVGTPAKKRYKLNRNFANGPLKIRRLTPLEALRLTGFKDEAYTTLREAGIADSCIYGFCGNGIVVNVFMAIVQNLDLNI